MGLQPLVLITGATDGIGRETAHQLARRGARVLLHGRDPGRVVRVRTELERSVGRAMPEPVLADLLSLEAVRLLARSLEERGERPEVLLSNAGVYRRQRAVSPEGFESTMAVNYLAPFLLTHLVLASPAGAALRRVVNVASVAHTRGRIDPADVGLERSRFEPYGAYATSKLALVLFSVELARRLRPRGVAVNALHPGVVSTKLLTEGLGTNGSDSVQDAAATSVMLAIDPIGERVSGGYFSYRREADPSPLARDAALARRVYEETARLVGVDPLLPAPG